MARGFESKDVEFQQAEAERTAERPVPVSAAERERREARRTLELSLANARSTLRAAQSPRHREVLQRAIDELEARLANT